MRWHTEPKRRVARVRTTVCVNLLVLVVAAADRFIHRQMARHRIPGLALAITQGDQVVQVRGYGEARHGEPVTGQTQFRIASLSKAFTALAVLQCVEAGQMELDAPVVRYLPDFSLVIP